MAINAPIQGTQADIIKFAMVGVDAMLEEENAREDAHLLLQVHDELVYEIRENRLKDLGRKVQDRCFRQRKHTMFPSQPPSKQARIGGVWSSLNRSSPWVY